MSARSSVAISTGGTFRQGALTRHLHFNQADDRFHQRVVARIAPTPNRLRNTRFGGPIVGFPSSLTRCVINVLISEGRSECGPERSTEPAL
jgi:hypothetical protein